MLHDVCVPAPLGEGSMCGRRDHMSLVGINHYMNVRQKEEKLPDADPGSRSASCFDFFFFYISHALLNKLLLVARAVAGVWCSIQCAHGFSNI